MDAGKQFNLYQDIAEGTGGDVYIGVVGPVRTGKSTFISRFMEELVLPRMPAGPVKDRLADELPQGGSGRTIMTTQPKFVPGEAVEVFLQDSTPVKVRMVDSVGYLVKGALGTTENETARMVHTPWFEQDIPFEQAAEVGTRKVINDHATIGMVVTTDGTITDIPRSAYVDAEERVVNELKALGKPFVLVLNSATPETAEAAALQRSLQNKYDVPTLLLNVKQMGLSDIQGVLEKILYEFPLREVRLNVPAWLNALDTGHWLATHVLDGVRQGGKNLKRMRDKEVFGRAFDGSPYSAGLQGDGVELGEGRVSYNLPLAEGLFNRILGEECGTEIKGDAHLLALMKELVAAKAEYDHVAEALKSVRETGYGLVTPAMNELTLQEPEIVRQGSRFGVKLKAHAPSLHLIRVDIETEVSPVVGTEKQSEELVRYLMDEFENDPQRIWSTDFFGKSLHDLVREGLSNKLMRMPGDAREKVQETLTRIINEGSGDMELAEEAAILASGSIPRCEVLKVSHHGEDDATSMSFVQRVAPQVAIISTNSQEEPDTPHPSVLSTLKRAGARIAITQNAKGGMLATLLNGQASVEAVEWANMTAISSSLRLAGLDAEQDALTIKNTGTENISLAGWYVFSVRGEEIFFFPDNASLAPGATARLGSTETPGACDWRFDDKNVWHNKKKDVAVLYDPYGKVEDQRDNGLTEE